MSSSTKRDSFRFEVRRSYRTGCIVFIDDRVSAGRSRPRTGAEELAAGRDLPAGAMTAAVVNLVRSEEAEAPAGTVVELGGECIALALRERTQGRALGQILAEQSVGVFVGAAFPGMVRRREVDAQSELPLDVLVAVELGAVIGSEGVDPVRFVAEQLDHAGIGVLDCGTGQRPNSQQTTFAFDCGHHARLAPPMDGVDLPVPEAPSPLDNRGPILDRSFASQPTAAVLPAVALPLLFARAAQMTPQGATPSLVRPDPQIDRFVAHHRTTFQACAADDLLRTEVLAKQRFDRRELHRPVTPVAARATAPTTRVLHRPSRPIRSIVARAVAPHLVPDRAAMSLQLSGDLDDAAAALPHRSNHISFLSAQLPVSHRSGMSHLLLESKRANQALQPTRMLVTFCAYAQPAPSTRVADL